MHADVTIYHNPHCSKSRQTLQLLRDKGIEPLVIEYLKNPPSKTELKKILSFLGMAPRELMRKQETVYKEAGLNDPKLTHDDLIAAMLTHPILMERPVVVVDGKAAVGRPPEAVLDIL